MGVYKAYSFENDYGGITNVVITDRYKVENEMPDQFSYYIKVTAGRGFVPSSYQPYATLLEQTILEDNTVSGISGECVFLANKNGIFEETPIALIVRHNMTYAFTNLVRNAYNDNTFEETQTVTRTDCPYFDRVVGNYPEYPFDINIEFSANMPFFESSEIAYNYRTLTGNAREEYLDEYCINYGDAPAEYTNDTQDYYIYNTFDTANIDKYGNVTYTGGNPTGRFLIFKANKTPVMYWVNKGNSLELQLIASEVVGSVYSSINRYDVIQKQFDESAWSDGLQYSNPWYNTFGSEYIPEGNHTIGVTFEKHPDILIFNNQADAEAYLAGELSEEEAWDWGNSGDPNIAVNETGTKELITEFGGNESVNVFSHDYIMSVSELAAIGGKFFDTNILQALLDGLKLYGNNPMDSVLSCLYFPFDLSSICDSVPVTDIYFGSYKMQNVSANRVSTRSGYKELGSTFIKPTFYNWLDYKATRIYLYLPYIGFVELDVSKYLNKTLKIVYLVDLHSGECEVSLCADDLLMDTYSGQIGIKQPITYNDLSAYYQSQITALRNGVMTALGLPVGGALTGAQVGSSGGPYGAIAGAAIGGGIGSGIAAPYAAYTGRNIINTKPPLFSKGGYSSEVGANMPQYAFLIFVYNEVEIPKNELQLVGKPSNASGRISDFSGFLQTNYVMLQCPGATEGEKNEIMQYLTNGVYI